MGLPPSSLNQASENPSMAIEDPLRAAASSVVVERRGDYSALCKWTIANFPDIQSRVLRSSYFEVGGFHCRLLVYPRGDSQTQPGNLSIYLQIMNPRNTSSSFWDCFASFRLAVCNSSDSSKSVVTQHDSWHRFSSEKSFRGWCDFASLNSLLDPIARFLHLSNDCILITADILILHEEYSFSFSRDNYDFDHNVPAGGIIEPVVEDGLVCEFTWKVHNFGLFREMIKTQKITSPVFPVGECHMRISVYESDVSGVEYLSMCLETEKDDSLMSPSDRNSCWCLFSVRVLNQKKPAGNGSNHHLRRDWYGRFAAAGDNKRRGNTVLGWHDYIKMADFVEPESGFFVGDTAVFSTSLYVVKESSSWNSDGQMGGKFTWRIEDFTRLKDFLEKVEITWLCIKSRIFQIGNRDCRLIVYPRGQSHESPSHLSVFLEVTENTISSDWSCFVSHRLSVVNQRMEDKSVAKESQNRYSKAAKDWGWREFITLTHLFDINNGFLVHDSIVLSADLLILKETSSIQFDKRLSSTFAWKVDNFLSFKEIMETSKIFSNFFQAAGGCELRIGVYISFDTICIYLENEESSGSDNFWVRYRMAIVNQKTPSKTVGIESSICTKTWHNSVHQFMKVSDMLEADAGFLLHDTVVLVCDILDCCPWFEFSDLELS